MSDVAAKDLPFSESPVEATDLMDEIDRLGPFAAVEDYQRLLVRAGGSSVNTEPASYLRGLVAGRCFGAVVRDGRDG